MCKYIVKTLCASADLHGWVTSKECPMKGQSRISFSEKIDFKTKKERPRKI